MTDKRPIKIAILSRGPQLYSTRRLREAAKARGHDVKIRNPLLFSILVEQGNPDLYYQGKRVRPYDAVIPRIGASVTFFGTAVVRQFEQMGVYTLNTSHAISVSRDKLRSLQVLSRHNIGLALTSFVRDKDRVLSAIEQVGGAPVIIKVLEGTQGVGVILAESDKMAQAIVETLQWARQNVLIQKFVKESKGRDMRAFVVGDRVVAAMRRVAQGDEFRSNVHRGGRTEAVELSPEYERTAIRAAHIMGLTVAGVDMLEGDDGPKIMEVNSSPGLEGIEKATGVDVAGAIIDHLEERVLFPDLDLHERLNLKSGYVVAEVPVAADWQMVGQQLRDSGLREQGVTVLNVVRGGVTYPNPDGDHEILAGDRMLCYGKLVTIKSLVPPRPRRRRRRTQSSDRAGSGRRHSDGDGADALGPDPNDRS